jgi:hypothetical protein
VLRAFAAAVLFLAIWAALDAIFNLRYPARIKEPPHWYLLPSIDVCVLLAIFTALGAFKLRPPLLVSAALAFVIVFVRLFRVADGLIGQSYFRSVNLTLDIPLLPNLWRLMWHTVPLPKLLLGTLGCLLALAVATFLVFLAVVYVQRFLRSGWAARGLFAGVVLLCYGLSSKWPTDPGDKLHKGLFGLSLWPVAKEQYKFVSTIKTLRQAKGDQIRAVQDKLAHLPADLKALKGADFLLFAVESYGSTVFHNRYLNGGIGPLLEQFGAAMSEHGYYVASNFIDSTTYGGGSAMAHATLLTGVRIGDTMEFQVLLQSDPPPRTMASVFGQAGYRTVLVQPGTVRPWPEGEVNGFEKKYYAWQLDYEGCHFGWATMPDEYIVDVIHRKEIEPRDRRPVFIEYALVSSHAPWSVIPTAINDWSKLDHGRVFTDDKAVKFPLGWSNLNEAGPAYAYSLYYDFELLKRYIIERVTRNALIVIFGDHQPVAALTGNDPSWAVPVHVLSRDRALIERFNAAGYASGMTPPSTGSVAGLETLLPELMERLSGDLPASPPEAAPGESMAKGRAVGQRRRRK